MTNSNRKRTIQLKMPTGMATHKLRKMIMFQMVQKLELDICFQCGKKIETVKDLSIEHKIPWLDSEDPAKLFFDLDNIAFSHLSCNSGSGRRYEKGKLKHPSVSSYKQGCRCPECKEQNKLMRRRYRAKKKLKE